MRHLTTASVALAPIWAALPGAGPDRFYGGAEADSSGPGDGVGGPDEFDVLIACERATEARRP